MLPNNKNNAWFFQRLIKQSRSFETSHATAIITKHTIKKTSSTTWKSLSRSLNKLLFVPLFCINFFLFFNTIQTFLIQLFWWKPIRTRGKNTPWYKDITRSEQKSRWNLKTKSNSRKRRTLGKVRFSLLSFNECSWEIKSKATSSKEICWGPTSYCSKQN
jgi:hypothetical protein